MRRIASAFALLLAALAAIVVVSLALAFRATLPAQGDRTLRLAALSAPVSITYDQHGIPRIRASNDADAAEALGYVHARDRMAQMDLMRRAAGGELAELIGARALPLDEYMRVLGTRRAAERAVAGLPPRTAALLAAYARGVNAFIAARGRLAAPEFVLLGRPRPWTPVDSMLWAELMGLYLSDNLRAELGRLSLEDHLGRDAILRLWPVSSPGTPTDEAARATRPDLSRLAAATLASIPAFPAPFTLPDTASNAWVVDGSRSATGAPLLAGDPHLAYGLPCLWYLARIDTPDATLAGATAPGIPFLVIGRNAHIAWTFTTTGADTEDVFVEKVLDDAHYQGPQGPLAFATRSERIHVRFGPDVVLRIRETRHGPVISDHLSVFGARAPSQGSALAVQIASLQDGNTAAFGLDLLEHAVDVADAARAAPSLTAPVQNLMVADRHAIALFTTGRVPVRAAGDGAFPARGDDGRADWTGWVAGPALPSITSPASGVLVNANERVTASRSTAFLGRDAFGDWRARRIHALLATRQRFSVDDFASFQGDVQSAWMAALLPTLRQTVARDELSSDALRLLDGWDGGMRGDEAAPLIAESWISTFGRALGKRRGDPEARATLFDSFVADALQARHCDASCASLLADALRASMQSLAARAGPHPTTWRWDAAHRAIFENPLWENVPILRTQARAALGVGGDGSTVDAQGAVWPNFASVHGAAYRGVYDLADLDRSRFVIATGESGNPLSTHLLDFSALWQRIGTVTIGPRPAVTTARLTLLPD